MRPIRQDLVKATASPADQQCMSALHPTVRFDTEVLERLCDDLGGDPDTVAALIELYLTQLPGRVRAVAVAMARGDREAIAFAAHALRSPSATLGLRAVADASAALERTAIIAELETVERCHQALVACTDEVRDLVAPWLR